MSALSEQLTFISDPGHGWLVVPLAELAALGIADQITPYSFVNGRFVYLEEDQDAGTYLAARRKRGHPEPQLAYQYVDYFDRDQCRYQPPAAPAATSLAEIEAGLRALWTEMGVSPERQAEILADVARRSSPEFVAGQMALLFPERP